MTSRELFSEKYGSRESFGMTPVMWDAFYETWQAAERDMLERCRQCNEYIALSPFPPTKNRKARMAVAVEIGRAMK